MFCYKLTKNENETLLAMCDEELIGKKIKNDIQVEITEDFYGNEKCDEEKALMLVKQATIINAIGSKTIEFLKKNDIVDEKFILKIKDVPHAQVIMI